ncbi:hypothetical protein C2845_PM07G15620 [Panicum miliaceum]|uniref:Uncharacterized protein n=1 Tax=Panicum miliaceum TaxID=4540 RepID=A0A3L6SMK8_PANMI|nr:hypothetical protein C2845_PM07G15620 [Panicum miliaceum]
MGLGVMRGSQWRGSGGRRPSAASRGGGSAAGAPWRGARRSTAWRGLPWREPRGRRYAARGLGVLPCPCASRLISASLSLLRLWQPAPVTAVVRVCDGGGGGPRLQQQAAAMMRAEPISTGLSSRWRTSLASDCCRRGWLASDRRPPVWDLLGVYGHGDGAVSDRRLPCIACWCAGSRTKVVLGCR